MLTMLIRVVASQVFPGSPNQPAIHFKYMQFISCQLNMFSLNAVLIQWRPWRGAGGEGPFVSSGLSAPPKTSSLITPSRSGPLSICPTRQPGPVSQSPWSYPNWPILGLLTLPHLFLPADHSPLPPPGPPAPD